MKEAEYIQAFEKLAGALGVENIADGGDVKELKDALGEGSAARSGAIFFGNAIAYSIWKQPLVPAALIASGDDDVDDGEEPFSLQALDVHELEAGKSVAVCYLLAAEAIEQIGPRANATLDITGALSALRQHAELHGPGERIQEVQMLPFLISANVPGLAVQAQAHLAEQMQANPGTVGLAMDQPKTARPK